MTGDQLVAARTALGLTQVELADAIGKHPMTISSYETGRKPIPRVVELAVNGLERKEPEDA